MNWRFVGEHGPELVRMTAGVVEPYICPRCLRDQCGRCTGGNCACECRTED